MTIKSHSEGEIFQTVLDHLDDTLFTMTGKKEDKIVSNLMEWFNTEARLKPVADLPDRIVRMEAKLRKMAKNLTVSVQSGKFSIKADAESETTLNSLRRGSLWFDPHPDADAAILTSLIEAD